MLKRSHSHSFVFLVFLSTTFITTSGFIKNSPLIPIDMPHALKIAGTSFGAPVVEEEVKSNFKKIRGNDRKRFDDDVANSDEMGETNQSLIYEVRDGKQIESAKIVAKNLLFTAVKNHWYGVEKSGMNDIDVKSFAEFSPFLRSKLESITYAPSTRANNEIVFRVEDWGRVVFTKTKTGRIASARWSIDTDGSH